MSGLSAWTRAHPVVTGWAAGVASVGGVALGLAAWLLFGGFDTTAVAPHLRLVGWAAHFAMENSVHQRAREVTAPSEFTGEQVRAGARLYGAHCASCHGGPGLARSRSVRGMIPTPPYLIDAPRQWSDAELHEIIADGVKMTGMPAWRETLSQEQVWSLVGFVRALPALTPAEFRRMTAVAVAVAGAGGGASVRTPSPAWAPADRPVASAGWRGGAPRQGPPREPVRPPLPGDLLDPRRPPP